MLYGLVTLVELVLLVYCVLDIVRTPAEQVRNLPKLLWLLLVVVLPVLGGIGWLLAGRPASGRGADRAPLASGGGARAARPARRPVAMSPDDDEDFLRGLRERAAEQRRQAEEERRRRDGGGPTSAAPGSGPA